MKICSIKIAGWFRKEIMKKICLIGCGNIGSRHLQSLVKLPFPIDIKIIEPFSESQELGKERLSEIRYDKELHNISWMKSIDELNDKPDLTIIATSAVGRVNLICKLLEMGHSRFLVEKVVCQSDNEYERLVKKFREFGAKGWVNTNRRYFESYKKLKKIFSDSEIIHISVSSSNVSALATSLIHYLDMFSFFTDDFNVNLNGDFLLNQLFPNKRGKDFVEFAGTVIGSIKNGSTFSMTSLPATKLPYVINIIGKDKHIMIDETNERITNLLNPIDKEISFMYEHVSGLTNKITEDILSKDNCNLTTIQESQIHHKEIFRIFNQHIKKLTNKEQKLCPIT